MSDLKNLREKIDFIDDEILNLLVERFKIIKSVSNLKRANNIEVVQKSRIDEIIQKVRNKASKNKIAPIIFEKIYSNIIELACDMEQKIIEKTE
ncbi:MAG: chorismate mutase [Acutalibacteraceae bacterium]